MAKYDAGSGQVRVLFDAADATEAAVRAFQWSSDKQAGIEAESPLEHLWEAHERGWQLEDQIRVSELRQPFLLANLRVGASNTWHRSSEIGCKLAAAPREAPRG